jgi:hypothetical protein
MPQAVATASGSSDARLLSAASLRRGHDTPGSVVRWLRLQPSVAAASIGRDRQTVDVRFRDGMQAAILPKLQHYVAVPGLRALARVSAPAGAPLAPQAAVWEPFAAELGLGPSAGDIEVQQLQAAGFAVDQKYDTNVTVAQLATLARFNVVYMHTHSGVSAGGDGVLASGELANGDPAVAPYIQDGSVITVGVSGSSQQYYGITSKFVSAHMGTFPANALLFLNGCALLRATTFWQTLHVRGAGAMVSWDQNAASKDDYLSAAAFFNVMGTGSSVSGALSTVRAAGYGTSSDNGVPATLGYVGDGSITLRAAAAGGSGNQTPPPATGTPVPVATATRTPVPVATATRTPTPAPVPTSTSTPVPTHPPVPPLISLASAVKPGTVQHISVGNLSPATPVRLRVTFPNGQIVQSQVTADAAGTARFQFVQAGSKVTRHSRKAVVEITSITASGTATATQTYTIQYGKIDVVANPRTLPAGGTGAILVHTKVHKAVTVAIKPAGGRATKLHGTTGKLGWVKLSYRVTPSVRHGQRLVIHATVRLNGKNVQATTTVTVA